MKLLVTGGAGFIGSHYVRHVLRNPEDEVVVLDALTYAGNPENLKEFKKNPRFSFVKGDITDAQAVQKAAKECDAIVNFAAETHVDKSIQEGGSFARTDVLGTYTLLNHARQHDLTHHQVSTDEVYGSIQKGSFTEDSPLQPNSPYSASKAGGDLQVRAFNVTYGLDTRVTRASNNYGTHQHPEKLIPRFLTNLLRGRKVPLYGDGLNVRDWLWVEDHCAGIDLILRKGQAGDVYNIGGEDERTNKDVTQMLLRLTGRDESFIQRVADRPGHDRRYSVDCRKLKKLGWKHTVRFEDGLRQVVEWYRANPAWWTPNLVDQ